MAIHQGTRGFDECLLSKGRLLGQDRLHECFLAQVTEWAFACLHVVLLFMADLS